MSQLFFPDGNSHVHLPQSIEEMLAAPDMVEDRMRAHPHREDMGAGDMGSAVTLTGHSPCLDHALLFGRDHIPRGLGLGLGPQRRVEAARRQIHDTAGAAAQATAVEAAVPSVVGAIAIET